MTGQHAGQGEGITMTTEDPHADQYPPPPSYVNDKATSPPALHRMLADQVEVRITFGDGSAYAAVFGPCWASLGYLREGRDDLGAPLTRPDDFLALPALNYRAMGLDMHQRTPPGLWESRPLGEIRTVPPGEALSERYAALAAERARLAGDGVPPAYLAEPAAPLAGPGPWAEPTPPAEVLLDQLRAAVAAGLGWRVRADAAAVLLDMLDGGQ